MTTTHLDYLGAECDCAIDGTVCSPPPGVSDEDAAERELAEFHATRDESHCANPRCTMVSHPDTGLCDLCCLWMNEVVIPMVRSSMQFEIEDAVERARIEERAAADRESAGIRQFTMPGVE